MRTLVLVVLASVVHGRRVHSSSWRWQGEQSPESQRALKSVDSRISLQACAPVIFSKMRESGRWNHLKTLATFLLSNAAAAYNPAALGGRMLVGNAAFATSKPLTVGRPEASARMSEAILAADSAKRTGRPALVRAGIAASALSAAFLLAPALRRQALALASSFGSLAFGWYQAYDAAALSNPLPVKSATSAVAYFLGDTLAQKAAGGRFSKGRVTRAMLAGGFSHGPQLHYWTVILDRFLSFGGAQWAVLVKVLLDQTLFALYINAAFTTFTEMLQKRSPRQAWNKVRATAWSCLKAGWKFWPAAHLITYSIIPLQMRVLWVDVLEVVWVAILSTQVATCDPFKEECKEEVGSPIQASSFVQEASESEDVLRVEETKLEEPKERIEEEKFEEPTAKVEPAEQTLEEEEAAIEDKSAPEPAGALR